MSAAPTFRKRTVLVLIAVGFAAMLGFLLTATYGERVDRQRGNTPSPTSRYATGFRALYLLVERAGGQPTLRGTSAKGEARQRLLVLTPNARTQPGELADAMVGHDGPKLIVLPKWITVPQARRPGREERFRDLPPDALVKLIAPVARVAMHEEDPAARLSYTRELPLRPFRVTERTQAIAGGRLVPLIAAPDGAAVLARVADTNTYILADPDLINNLGLASRQNAGAAIALLAALDPDGAGRIAFDTLLPFGAGGRNIGQLIFEPPFAGVSIALLAAALLAGIVTFTRFGPVRREPRALPFGKRALIENIVGLARRAGRTAEGGPAYVDAVRDWAARRLSLPRGLSIEAIEAELDALPTAIRYREAADRVHMANTEADLLRAAQHLDDWRKEVKA